VFLDPAFDPKKTFAPPVVLLIPANIPNIELLSPVVVFLPVKLPTKVFELAERFSRPARFPTNTLLLPVVLLPANTPTNVLNWPWVPVRAPTETELGPLLRIREPPKLYWVSVLKIPGTATVSAGRATPPYVPANFPITMVSLEPTAALAPIAVAN
jgi:hypothetical protein